MRTGLSIVLVASGLLGACSPQTRDHAKATANSAAADARAAGHDVARETAPTRRSLKAAGHDLADAADAAGDAARRLAAKADREMRRDR